VSTATTPPRTRHVALVGRPNVGKTSLLMHLTGTRQRPVNFPGTSVERAESTVAVGDQQLRVVDLPGIVSLQPASPDEAVAIEFLRAADQRPDLLCAVVDATKLAVELRFLQQVRGLGLPVVVALTKVDVADREGRPVAVQALERALGVRVIAVNGFDGSGAHALRQALLQPPAAPVAGVGATAGVPSPAGTAATGIAAAVQQPEAAGRRSRSDRIDAVLLHRVLGPLVLLAVLFAMFQLVFTVAQPFMTLIDASKVLPAGALRSFLVDGLVNGLGSALVFVPQIALLIAFVTLLEGSGYMARAVFLLDRLLRKVGLTGRSFVPLASSFACAIPGILSSRIIADERDRIATIVVAPLMSCSARLPVYVVMLAAFFPPHQAGLLLLALYVLGIAAAAAVAFVLRRTALAGGRSLLLMELPGYQRPSARMVSVQVFAAVRSFLGTAGSVILIATVVVWGLSYYPRPAAIGERFAAERAALVADAGDDAHARLDAREQAAYLEQSWLADIGKTIQPAFAPAGFDWRLTVGILAAFPARELVVPTLGTLYSLGAVEARRDQADPQLLTQLRAATDAAGRPTMNGLVALAVMAFFALCSQCASTLAAIGRETHGWKWPVFTFSYMTAMAWLVAVAIYQTGSLLGYGLSR
jgi:ferrous iron transport protein B